MANPTIGRPFVRPSYAGAEGPSGLLLRRNSQSTQLSSRSASEDGFVVVGGARPNSLGLNYPPSESPSLLDGLGTPFTLCSLSSRGLRSPLSEGWRSPPLASPTAGEGPPPRWRSPLATEGAAAPSRSASLERAASGAPLAAPAAAEGRPLSGLGVSITAAEPEWPNEIMACFAARNGALGAGGALGNGDCTLAALIAVLQAQQDEQNVSVQDCREILAEILAHVQPFQSVRRALCATLQARNELHEASDLARFSRAFLRAPLQRDLDDALRTVTDVRSRHPQLRAIDIVEYLFPPSEAGSPRQRCKRLQKRLREGLGIPLAIVRSPAGLVLR